MIEFTIHEPPVAKGRPKFSVVFDKGIVPKLEAAVRDGRINILALLRDGANVHTYTPERTAQATEVLAWSATKFKPRKPLDGPIGCTTVHVVQPPQKFDAGRSRDWPHIKPDDDNYRKLVLDAFKGMFWHDDGQVCGGESWKVYGEKPRTFIRIWQLGREDLAHVFAMIGETMPQLGMFGEKNG